MNKAQKLHQNFCDERNKHNDFQRTIGTTEKAFDDLIKSHARHFDESQEARAAKSTVIAVLKAEMPKVRQRAPREDFIAYVSLCGGEVTMAGIKEDYSASAAKRITKKLLSTGDLVSRKSNSGATTYYKLAPKWLETASA